MSLVCLLLLSSPQVHDPAVLRCAFEDRSRMVLFNPTPGLWMAYNPTTCTLQKVWEGDVDWRGKVYDFSQDNSRAKGRTIYEVPSELVRLNDGAQTAWTLKNVSWKDGWNLSADSVIVSPEFDTTGFTRLCIMFDETSRKGSVRTEVVSKSQDLIGWFNSTRHGHSDTDWQFNMKIFPDVEGPMRVRITQPGDFGKKLKAVRAFADWRGWRSDGQVEWKGYRMDAARNVLTCLVDVSSGSEKIHIEQDFGADGQKWWTEVRSDFVPQNAGYPCALRMMRTKGEPIPPGGSDVKWITVAKNQPYRLEVPR